MELPAIAPGVDSCRIAHMNLYADQVEAAPVLIAWRRCRRATPPTLDLAEWTMVPQEEVCVRRPENPLSDSHDFPAAVGIKHPPGACD